LEELKVTAVDDVPELLASGIEPEAIYFGSQE
jgi:hypothetical protein